MLYVTVCKVRSVWGISSLTPSFGYREKGEKEIGKKENGEIFSLISLVGFVFSLKKKKNHYYYKLNFKLKEDNPTPKRSHVHIPRFSYGQEFDSS